MSFLNEHHGEEPLNMRAREVRRHMLNLPEFGLNFLDDKEKFLEILR